MTFARIPSVLLVALLATCGSASAATFTVDRTATDAVDANVGGGGCAAVGGGCTLRAAVQEANVTPALDTIVLPSGQTAHLTIGAAGTTGPDHGDLDVTHDLTVQSSGAEPATIDGGDVDRIFDVPAATPNIKLTLTGLTLQNGKVTGESGGG